jgi:transcriptional regulator GlxA family with amidase domain
VLSAGLGDVVSSAGTVAALDCCLHLVPMDELARRSGLGSSASLRRHFREVLGTSPRRHRDQLSA